MGLLLRVADAGLDVLTPAFADPSVAAADGTCEGDEGLGEEGDCDRLVRVLAFATFDFIPFFAADLAFFGGIVVGL